MENCPDLLLLDIQLHGNSTGIDLARAIAPNNIPIIFTTQYPEEEYYQSSIQIPNSIFLVKPFHKLTLNSAIHQLLNPISRLDYHGSNSQEEDALSIRIGRKREIIRPETIIWVSSNLNYCTIQTQQKQFTVKKSLRTILSILPNGLFIPIHKSFIVQKSFIRQVNTQSNTVMVDNYTLPLGRNYLKTFKDLIKKLG